MYTFILFILLTMLISHNTLPLQSFGTAKRCEGRGTITEGGSIITSPNYPQSYDNDVSCDYLIRAPQGQVVLLTFLHIDIESEFACIYDALLVRTIFRPF